MKRHLLAFLLFVSSASAAQAGNSWVFQQSYYSHDPMTQVRIGRQYSPNQVFTRPQGQYIESGYRYNRSQINVRGLTYDTTYQFEGWFQTGAKF